MYRTLIIHKVWLGKARDAAWVEKSRDIQKILNTELKYARVLGIVYGIEMRGFDVLDMNVAIYCTPMVENVRLTIASAMAVGNQRRRPRRTARLAIWELVGLLMNGTHIVRAERRMNQE